MPEKVNKLVQALTHNPDAGYVFSDALVVDEVLHPVGYTMWESIRFTPTQRRQFERGKQLEVLLKHNVVTGATMAFRAGLKGVVLPIPEGYVHDEWIALVASAIGMYGVLIGEPLIRYRQHSQQLIGGLRLSFAGQVKRAWHTKGESFESLLHQEEVKYLEALERLAGAGRLAEGARQLFNSKIQHIRARRALYRRRRGLARLVGVCGELLTGRYGRFANGWKSAARDLLL